MQDYPPFRPSLLAALPKAAERVQGCWRRERSFFIQIRGLLPLLSSPEAMQLAQSTLLASLRTPLV